MAGSVVSPLTNEAIARMNAAMREFTDSLQNIRISLHTEDPEGDPGLDQERRDAHDATVPAWAEDALDPLPENRERG